MGTRGGMRADTGVVRLVMALAACAAAVFLVTVGRSTPTLAQASLVLCSSGAAVSQPEANAGLVQDCAVLLSSRDTLAGTKTLNWSEEVPMASWDGVTLKRAPPRVSELNLQDKAANQHARIIGDPRDGGGRPCRDGSGRLAGHHRQRCAQHALCRVRQRMRRRQRGSESEGNDAILTQPAKPQAWEPKPAPGSLFPVNAGCGAKSATGSGPASAVEERETGRLPTGNVGNAIRGGPTSFGDT